MAENKERSIARLIQACESSGFEASVAAGGRIRVSHEGWPVSSGFGGRMGLDNSIVELWSDRFEILVHDTGGMSVLPDYFSPMQLAMHVAVAAIFAMQAWIAPEGVTSPIAFIGGFALSQGLVAAGLAWSSRRAFAAIQDSLSRLVLRELTQDQAESVR